MAKPIVSRSYDLQGHLIDGEVVVRMATVDWERLDGIGEAILELAYYLGGPGASSVDLEVAMKLRALATGDNSEIKTRERRIAERLKEQP